MISDFKIKAMANNEVQFALDLAAGEGWNPGINDAKNFYRLDPNGFFQGMVNDEPVSAISAVSYGNIGFIGLYIVKPGYRKKGYGIKTWDTAMKYLEGKNIGLDAVKEQQENYFGFGFRIVDYNHRYRCSAGKTQSEKKSIGVMEASNVGIDMIARYDDKIFFAPRHGFLKSWVFQEKSFAAVKIDKGQLRGYGVIRKCINGYKIGPLFADDQNIAVDLLDALVAFPETGSHIYLDIPESNASAIEIANKRKMEHIFTTARMFTRGQVKQSQNRVYGLTTLEIG